MQQQKSVKSQSQDTSFPPHTTNLQLYHLTFSTILSSNYPYRSNIKIISHQAQQIAYFLTFCSKSVNPMDGSSRKLSKIIQKWRKKKNGQFVVYSKDNKRFVVPLGYLNHPMFRVLLEMAEEEYGLPIQGPLRVPCEKELVEYLLGVFGKSDSSALQSFKQENKAKILSSVLYTYV